MLQKTFNKSGSYIPCLQENKELWDRFTLKEEYNPPFVDKYGRFPDYLSFNRNFFEPSVSRFLVENNLIKPRWPDGKQFAVCLTHDIDVIYQYRGLGTIVGAGSELALRRNLRKTAKMLFSGMNKHLSPWYNFQKILDIEKKYDATSSFYFLACEQDELDYNYDLDDVKDVAGMIIDHGGEIGLHGSRLSYENLNQIKIEKKRLENTIGHEVVGYRNHYLCFKTPNTWQNLKRAGFLYDTTLGYDGVIGFRNGMCHPFQPYDLANDTVIDGIWEIPLIIMDCTILGEYYMRLDAQQAWLQTKHIIDIIAELHGVLTILWHNTFCVEKEMIGFYDKLISYCQEQNSWLSNSKQIIDYWVK